MSIPGSASPLFFQTAAAADAAAAGPTKSLRFNSADSAYLSRSQSSGNSKTFTYAFWFKAPVSGTWPCIIGADSSSNERAHFRWNGTQLQCYFISGGSQVLNLQTNRVFRDKSAWYHIVLAFDTTQSTASDRAKLYVNGTQESSFAYSTYPSQNATVPINNSSSTAVIGRRNYDASNYFNGYLADIYFIDGSQLDPTSFGAYDDNGVWQAAAYSGTFGTNGFHLLDFANESTVGHDSSGNENDFTANNLVSVVAPRQGYNGGNSYVYGAGNSSGGGGGGAGGAGDPGVSNVSAGDGGSGRASTITGSSVTYGGGGGGGSWGTAGGAGGSGGGGAGKLGGSSTGAANPGTDGLGGGGGGAGYSNADWQAGGDGGSGRVIIRYATSHGDLTSANSGSKTTSGSDTIYQWTTVGSGSITFPGSSSISVQYLVLGGGGGAESGGGGGGGMLEGTLTVTGGTSHTVTVGDGGTGASPYPSPGAAANGGNSVFSTITALGGGRGGGGDSGSSPTSGGSGGGGGTHTSAATTGGSGTGQDDSDLDLLFDVPTNGTQSDTGAGGEVSGNYCTWNPNQPTFATTSFSNGNLDSSIQFTNGSVTPYATGTIAVSSGSWYWEITLTQESSDTEYIGIIDGSHAGGAWSFSVIGAYFSDARKAVGGSPSSYGATYTTGDVIGVALDADNGNLVFYKNGVSQGTAASGMTFESYKPFTSANGTSTAQLVSANFGQRAFAYSAPSGYKALCTTNLPTPTIADGSNYFDTLLWTGDGASSTREITGLSMANAPDWIWAKERNGGSSHATFDAVRGFGSNNVLKTNSTDAEAGSNGGYINSTSATSITWAQGTSSAEFYDANNKTYVAWCWDAGSSTVSNTDGSITSSVRANPTAGFSIVSYTGNGTSGATVGHSLNAAPSFYIIKQRVAGPGSDLYNWNSYHSSLGATKFIALNTTAAASTAPLFNDTAPTSTVFSLGSSTQTYNNVNNASNVTYIAYCFAPVAGFSAFGEYGGNSSTDGPFIYTGFKVAWLMIKNVTDNGWSWNIYDTTRDSTNANNKLLRPDYAANEISAYAIDFLSNGFRLKWSDGAINHSGKDYIYAAFAENPFQANGGLAR